MDSEQKEAIARSCSGKMNEFARIIELRMADRGVSVRKLVESGVIKESTRKRFFSRLKNGQLSLGEFLAIMSFLGVDLHQATLALKCKGGSAMYFHSTCKTTADLANATLQRLHESHLDGASEFEPIRESLCQSVATRTARALIDHQKRVEALKLDDSAFRTAFG